MKVNNVNQQPSFKCLVKATLCEESARGIRKSVSDFVASGSEPIGLREIYHRVALHPEAGRDQSLVNEAAAYFRAITGIENVPAQYAPKFILARGNKIKVGNNCCDSYPGAMFEATF